MTGTEARPQYLIAGDSRDIPAIRELLAKLPVDAYGHVFIEIVTGIQIQILPKPSDVSLTWLRRDRAQTSRSGLALRGVMLTTALSAWISEWMPEEHENHQTPWLLWVGGTTSHRVTGFYHDLGRRLGDPYQQYPQHDH